MSESSGYEVLEVPLTSIGLDNYNIYPVLLWDKESTILVDTGLSEIFSDLNTVLEKKNITVKQLTKIVITHSDLDHIGNLAKIQKGLDGKVEIIAHEEEIPFIEFRNKSSKISSDKYSELKSIMRSIVNVSVSDNDILSHCGGIKIIHTPGHSPGHICLYIPKYKVLIAGDALNIVDDKLIGPNPKHTPDFIQAIQSLKKLLDLDIESIICYHGGVYKNKDIKDSILKIIKCV